MPLNILRWKGGFSGDLLLNLILRSMPSVKSNVTFLSTLSDHGAIELDYSKLKADTLTQVERIALASQYINAVDAKLLQEELSLLTTGSDTWWLKSHYYDQNVHTDCIIDIITNHDLLPFVVAANINKTFTLSENINHLVGKITDPQLRYQYSVYSVAKDCVTSTANARTININQVFAGWDAVKSVMKTFGILLNDQYKNLYQSWIYRNQQYFPSITYQQCLDQQCYDVDTPGLTMIEQYCLLVIAGNNFKKL
jgi:hypothetical protein